MDYVSKPSSTLKQNQELYNDEENGLCKLAGVMASLRLAYLQILDTEQKKTFGVQIMYVHFLDTKRFFCLVSK